MRIYVSHPRDWDFESELREQLRRSPLAAAHTLVFPRRGDDEFVGNRLRLAECDLVIAEYSQQSTEQGIELGWADAAKTPIFRIRQARAPLMESMRLFSRCDVAVYDDLSELRGAWLDPFAGVLLSY
jgi:hypothetical protein